MAAVPPPHAARLPEDAEGRAARRRSIAALASADEGFSHGALGVHPRHVGDGRDDARAISGQDARLQSEGRRGGEDPLPDAGLRRRRRSVLQGPAAAALRSPDLQEDHGALHHSRGRRLPLPGRRQPPRFAASSTGWTRRSPRRSRPTLRRRCVWSCSRLAYIAGPPDRMLVPLGVTLDLSRAPARPRAGRHAEPLGPDAGRAGRRPDRGRGRAAGEGADARDPALALDPPLRRHRLRGDDRRRQGDARAPWPSASPSPAPRSSSARSPRTARASG